MKTRVSTFQLRRNTTRPTRLRSNTPPESTAAWLKTLAAGLCARALYLGPAQLGSMTPLTPSLKTVWTPELAVTQQRTMAAQFLSPHQQQATSAAHHLTVPIKSLIHAQSHLPLNATFPPSLVHIPTTLHTQHPHLVPHPSPLHPPVAHPPAWPLALMIMRPPHLELLSSTALLAPA